MSGAIRISHAARALLADGIEYACRDRPDRMFAVVNPVDGSHIADVPDCGADDARAAIDTASLAQKQWAARTAKDRAAVLRRWHGLILDFQDSLAEILTLEQGKPLAEARGEIAFGANFVEWFAEEGKRMYGDIVPQHSPDKRCLVLKQPIGVVAAITPWNFPSGMITRKVSPALAAGCAIVVKPAEDTPLSAVALALLAERAGFPEGVMRVVTASRPDGIAGVLTDSPNVRKVSFTGSTRVGKLLMRECADTVKKVALELGGNAPLLVFDDADLDAAVTGTVLTKFRNAGQTCIAANRVYVQRPVVRKFTERLAAAVEQLRVGDGLEAGTEIGPLINESAVRKVESLVNEAVTAGAKAVIGGKRDMRGGNFFQPTVLENVGPDLAICKEEIFGPVLPIYEFSDEQEAIRLANDTSYGLAAYFWSRDIGRIWRVAEGLEFGMVGVNEGLSSNEGVPFGGIKQSGIGREGSRYGLDEFVDIKYVALGGITV